MGGLVSPDHPQTIYDVGMNNGDDSAYYLAKGYNVVGIDANPDMCRHCSNRFFSEIQNNRMAVINIGVSDEFGILDFHINKSKPAISSFAPERFTGDWVPPEWERVKIPVMPLSHIIGENGPAHFIKIDVEFYDKKVLHDLMTTNVRPPFISTEAQEIGVFRLLLDMGYRRFKLVPGASVHDDYADAMISRVDGRPIPYRFPPESSGPFGDDVHGKWLDEDEVNSRLVSHGVGWIDIHAAF